MVALKRDCLTRPFDRGHKNSLLVKIERMELMMNKLQQEGVLRLEDLPDGIAPKPSNSPRKRSRGNTNNYDHATAVLVSNAFSPLSGGRYQHHSYPDESSSSESYSTSYQQRSAQQEASTSPRLLPQPISGYSNIQTHPYQHFQNISASRYDSQGTQLVPRAGIAEYDGCSPTANADPDDEDDEEEEEEEEGEEEDEEGGRPGSLTNNQVLERYISLAQTPEPLSLPNGLALGKLLHST